MATIQGETDKYEVQEVIGTIASSATSHALLTTPGRGAFGIIRKVRRKADGQVCCSNFVARSH